MLPRAALEFYATQQVVAKVAANEVGRIARRFGDDFDASWRRLGPSINAIIAEAQLQLAAKSTEYVPRFLDQADIPDRPQGELVPESVAGVASDGRPLETLTYRSVVGAKAAVAGGATVEQALSEQSQWLQLVAQLQAADAARQALGILTTSRKNLGGHVRVLNPPSCPRCAILGGRFYRWSQGFQRHPQCDCSMAPVPSKAYAEAEGFVQTPMEAYRAGEIRGLTQAQVKALEDGAEINSVVNAYRGVSSMSPTTRLRVDTNVPASVVAPGQPDLLAFIPSEVRFASQNATRRTLTPEGIYRQAGGDRDEAIRLLREYGYIV